MHSYLCMAVLLFTVCALNAEEEVEFVCPNYKNTQFEHPKQCDRYYHCIEGKATSQLCPDGLVFDKSIRLLNKCTPIFNIDCEERTELQEPQGNEICPRKNGFFAHPTPEICDVFYNCQDGKAIEVRCTGGLFFNELSGICEWPNTAGRTGCADPKIAEEAKKDGDFRCPTDPTKRLDKNGVTIEHPRFVHETDCQKFYVCLNGIEKRQLQCDKGQVFNGETGTCDEPENVAECKDWYKEDGEDSQ